MIEENKKKNRNISRGKGGLRSEYEEDERERERGLRSRPATYLFEAVVVVLETGRVRESGGTVGCAMA